MKGYCTKCGKFRELTEMKDINDKIIHACEKCKDKICLEIEGDELDLLLNNDNGYNA